MRYAKLLTVSRVERLTARIICNSLGLPMPAGDDDVVDPGRIMLLLLAGCLDTVGIITRDQRILLLQYFKDRLIEHAETLQQKIDTAADIRQISGLPVINLGFIERRYVLIDGKPGLLDLQTGEVLEGLAKAQLETIAYNLTTLYAQNVILTKLKEEQNADPIPEN